MAAIRKSKFPKISGGSKAAKPKLALAASASSVKKAKMNKAKLATSPKLSVQKPPPKVQVAPVSKTEEKKKVSQKLLETLQKRKTEAAKRAPHPFSNPPRRRGRRPKASAEYTPEHREEEAYVLESDNESIEYDTGIRVKKGGEDSGFSMDRLEDFDEELNFDW